MSEITKLRGGRFRLLTMAGALMCLLVSSGCYIMSLRVHVAADGSGRIAVLVAHEINELSEYKIKKRRNDKDKQKQPQYMFEERERWKTLAHAFGKSTKLEQVVPYSNSVVRGVVAVYSFDSITNVYLPLKNDATMYMQLMLNPSIQKDKSVNIYSDIDSGVSFRFSRGATNSLDIVLPETEPPDDSDVEDYNDYDDRESLDQGINLGSGYYLSNITRANDIDLNEQSIYHVDVRIEVDGSVAGYKDVSSELISSNGVVILSYDGEDEFMNKISNSHDWDDKFRCYHSLQKLPQKEALFMTNNLTIYFKKKEQ